MIWMGGDLLDLKAEGSQIRGAEVGYVFKGTPYKETTFTIEWLPIEPSEIKSFGSEGLGVLRPIEARSAGASLDLFKKSMAVTTGLLAAFFTF